MYIPRQSACILLIQLQLLPSLLARRWVGFQTKRQLLPRSVSDGRRLTINVYIRAHHGPVCGFLVFWLQLTIGPFALFNRSGFDYTCFTVMYHR